MNNINALNKDNIQALKDFVYLDTTPLYETDGGIFYQPFGVPNEMKCLCVYQRNYTGGVGGFSCWSDDDEYDDMESHNYENDVIEEFVVLSNTLKYLKPDITDEEILNIRNCASDNFELEEDYYGNSEEYTIFYIPLKRVCELLGIEYDINLDSLTF